MIHDLKKLRRIRESAEVEIKMRDELIKYCEAQIQTAKTEIKQFQASIIECDEKEIETLKTQDEVIK